MTKETDQDLLAPPGGDRTSPSYWDLPTVRTRLCLVYLKQSEQHLFLDPKYPLDRKPGATGIRISLEEGEQIKLRFNLNM